MVPEKDEHVKTLTLPKGKYEDNFTTNRSKAADMLYVTDGFCGFIVGTWEQRAFISGKEGNKDIHLRGMKALGIDNFSDQTIGEQGNKKNGYPMSGSNHSLFR